MAYKFPDDFRIYENYIQTKCAELIILSGSGVAWYIRIAGEPTRDYVRVSEGCWPRVVRLIIAVPHDPPQLN